MGRAWIVALAALIATPALAQGRGYILIISNAQGMTQISYPSAAACQRAIAEIKAQFADRRIKRTPEGGIIIPATGPQVFCVPR